jgi:phosphopantothenoylcysteine synthetase/decarboxylase
MLRPFWSDRGHISPGAAKVGVVTDDPYRGVLYVVVCAAPAASDAETLVRLARDAGWRVCVVTSPLGRRFVDTERLSELTGTPVRSEFRMPDEPNELPVADAVIVAPATFNTINKWATGIADTFVVGLLCELTGFGLPIVAAPLLKDALARHVAFAPNLEALRAMGVRVLFDPAASPDARMPPWEEILTELHTLLDG